jgi:GDPmannose 4,6-dehydratase
MSFNHVGVKMGFKGEGVDEIGFVEAIDHAVFEAATGQACGLSIGEELVHVDPKYFRPTEVDLLIGDATKARTKLGWSPKHTLQDLVTDMMQSDIKVMQKETYLKTVGFRANNYFE